jgi:hypothetical protein
MVVVPADEVVFLPDLPVRISDTRAAAGSKVSGPVMRVTAAPLIADSSLSEPEAKRVRPGDPVVVEQREAGVRTRGVVGQVDRVPGGRGLAPDRHYLSVILATAPRSLAGASVQLRIARGP